ncbi:uncharacterized protein LOC129659367 isoform X18 [Bubalus kerabau]|uniref:uncharacterized protein LOC129659367 isoform X18 n=1 Tax=Bubalus carabanensis TaxID=3119969 RepID=UPI00244EE1F9|nr:uncharacterized protein LOC129659367 isoform X18 [Bubalus carabanensis]
MHSLPLCCPGKTVYSYLISQWDILLEDRGQHLEAVRRRITHAGGIQQPCADDADAACGEEPEDSSQQLAQASFGREGNGTPLQYSCLENPMDGGAWLAAAHGVVKSRT